MCAAGGRGRLESPRAGVGGVRGVDAAGLAAAADPESRGLTAAVCRTAAFAALVAARGPAWATRLAAGRAGPGSERPLDWFDACVQE